MAKKRTKNQKREAKHNFTFSWNPTSPEAKSGTHVKGQFKNEANSSSLDSNDSKNSIKSAQTEELVKTRKNIFKSLILAGIILALEFVLYFFWK